MGVNYFRLNKYREFLPLNKPSHPGSCKQSEGLPSSPLTARASPSPTWSALRSCWPPPRCPYQISLTPERNPWWTNKPRCTMLVARNQESSQNLNLAHHVSQQHGHCAMSRTVGFTSSISAQRCPLVPQHLPSCRDKAQPLAWDAWDRNFEKRSNIFSFHCEIKMCM